MNKARQAVIDAGVFVEGHFIFADSDHALIKLEMDHLWQDEKSLKTILKMLAEAKGLPPADLILGVPPDGGQLLAAEICKSYLPNTPFIPLERIPSGAKQDFRLVNQKDVALIEKSSSVRIYEDVVTTLSSVAGVVKLLNPQKQSIHSLAIWRRGTVKEEYRKGVTDHYLVEELVPSFVVDRCPVCKNLKIS